MYPGGYMSDSIAPHKPAAELSHGAAPIGDGARNIRGTDSREPIRKMRLIAFHETAGEEYVQGSVTVGAIVAVTVTVGSVVGCSGGGGGDGSVGSGQGASS